MSTTAFAACEREYNAQLHHIEVSRDERARGIDSIVSEQLRREAEFDRLRLERELNGPTPLELAHKRIVELEALRDEIYRDVAEWIRDLQNYFPCAKGLHDVYRGIEAMEAEILALKREKGDGK